MENYAEIYANKLKLALLFCQPYELKYLALE